MTAEYDAFEEAADRFIGRLRRIALNPDAYIESAVEVMEQIEAEGQTMDEAAYAHTVERFVVLAQMLQAAS